MECTRMLAYDDIKNDTKEMAKFTYRKDVMGWSVFYEGHYVGSADYARSKEQALRYILV